MFLWTFQGFDFSKKYMFWKSSVFICCFTSFLDPVLWLLSCKGGVDHSHISKVHYVKQHREMSVIKAKMLTRIVPLLCMRSNMSRAQHELSTMNPTMWNAYGGWSCIYEVQYLTCALLMIYLNSNMLRHSVVVICTLTFSELQSADDASRRYHPDCKYVKYLSQHVWSLMFKMWTSVVKWHFTK